MFSLLEKLRTWGIKGAIDYLRSLGAQNDIVSTIEDNAKRYPLQPTTGVTVVGPLFEPTSLSKVLRDLIIKLSEANIPFQTFNTSSVTSTVQEEVKHLITTQENFRALKYQMVIGYFPPSLLKRRVSVKKLQIVFWEFESGLFECDNSLSRYKILCGMSDFVVDAIKKQAPTTTKSQKVLYPFLSPRFDLTPRNEVRNSYGIKDDDFVVFYNFSLNSCYYRKYPEGTLHAFAQAFSNIDNAKLILKINGANSHPDKMLTLKRLSADLGIENKIVTITDYLPTATIYSITAACDCYLSLHRGEGFGLGIAEAMSLGVPPVITAYSAPLEFCSESNSMLIPYVMRKVKPNEIDNKIYRFVKEWAEADIHAAAKALKQLYSEPKKREQLGNAAKASISAQFSTENFKASIESFLRQQ